MKKYISKAVSLVLLAVTAVLTWQIFTVKATGFLDFTSLARLIFGGVCLVCVSVSAWLWKNQTPKAAKAKFVLWLAAVCVILFGVFGSKFYKKPAVEVENKESVFQAELLEIREGAFLVEPMEGTWERTSSDKIELPMMNMAPSPEPKVGDILEIAYNGELQEVYPARISTVFSIRVVGSEQP